MNIFGLNNTPHTTFEGYKVRRLNPAEREYISSLRDKYDVISDRIANYKGTYRHDFRSLFPGLSKDNVEKAKGVKGFFLHSNDDAKVKMHVFKRTKDSGLTMNLINDDREVLLSCCDEKLGYLAITSSDEYDKIIKSNLFAESDVLLENVERELDTLSKYAEYYPQLKKMFSPGATKEEILDKIQELENPAPAIKPILDKLIDSYNSFRETLYQRNGAFTLRFREAYQGKKANVKEKGVSFFNKNGEKINYLQTSSFDDRVFRLMKYDKDGNLNLAVIGYKDGTFAEIKNKEKYKVTMPHNLRKMDDAEVAQAGLPEISKFLIKEFGKFKNFIDEFASTYKLVKQKKDLKTYKEIAQEEEAKLYAKQKGEELKKAEKAARLAEKERKLKEKQERAEKRAAVKIQREETKAAKKAAREVARERAAELRLQVLVEKKKRAAEKSQKQIAGRAESVKARSARIEAAQAERASKLLKKPAEPKPVEDKALGGIFYNKSASDLKQIKSSVLIEVIQEIFSTPVQARNPRFSHEKLKDGRLFAGRFFITAKDGAKVSVTQIKSPRYVDFFYYSIKVEKDGKTCVMNLDPVNNGIILSNSEGKPILHGAQVKYISKDEYMASGQMAAKMPGYIKELFIGKEQKGEIVDSLLEIKKRPTTPEEMLNAELPPNIELPL